jgi:hypothetical protein
MTMKKILFTVAVLCIAGAAFAQTTYGVKLGPNFSSMSNKVDGHKETLKMIVGLSGGVYANIPIAPEFYIQPSLMYEGKGAKAKDSDEDGKVRLNYLTLPIDLLFKPQMPNGSGSWIIGVGPYLGYGFSGKYSEGGGDPFKGDFGLKRFDAGANVQLGYEMANGFNIGLNAELGLLNLVDNGDSDNSARNTSFGVMVGYTLGQR